MIFARVRRLRVVVDAANRAFARSFAYGVSVEDPSRGSSRRRPPAPRGVDIGIEVRDRRQFAKDGVVAREHDVGLSSGILRVEREARDGMCELVSRHENDPRVVPESLAQSGLDPLLQLRAARFDIGLEPHVAAREHRLHLGEPEVAEQSTQFGALHGHAVHVDSAQQRHPGRHAGTLPRGAHELRNNSWKRVSPDTSGGTPCEQVPLPTATTPPPGSVASARAAGPTSTTSGARMNARAPGRRSRRQ
jgi:hypothetical protein